MKEKLAIVIPAYKAEFLREALVSIAAQTCQQFHLYIGDDNSPQDLYSIVKEFETRIPMTYRKFETNAGGKDLVSQWKRCIDLTQDESWIWLFSDDDVMGADCVERFFEGLGKQENVDLFHFDIRIINRFGQVIQTCNPFPKQLAVNDFFSKRINREINSTVVEYIFSRKIYTETGFINFDLAWCSDDATWIAFGRKNGIVTLPESTVYFRDSGINISSDFKDKGIVQRKLKSNLAYMQWVTQFFKSNGITEPTSEFTKLRWICSTLLLSTSFSIAEKTALIKKVVTELGATKLLVPAKIYMYYLALKALPRSAKNIKITQ
ncbi:glycosyltransferase [Dyadobacter sp. CY326]|uniref:glycosyltransferase family 2 protein n=1 Tax=Dyadobacter sp. CY326 TaxID=2907300 RepID=UPI001F175DAF|nr:glycosyltransferase [Dyadobacter sp. CY326]MCE7066592.1 glycosyltransferase [Dyadobacter sp. CY326]